MQFPPLIAVPHSSLAQRPSNAPRRRDWARELLTASADPQACDADGLSASCYARPGLIEVAALLGHAGTAEVLGDDEALVAACRHGNEPLVECEQMEFSESGTALLLPGSGLHPDSWRSCSSDSRCAGY